MYPIVEMYWVLQIVQKLAFVLQELQFELQFRQRRLLMLTNWFPEEQLLQKPTATIEDR